MMKKIFYDQRLDEVSNYTAVLQVLDNLMNTFNIDAHLHFHANKREYKGFS